MTHSKTYRVNGVDLHVVEAGDPGGPVVLFLHGFPEFWYAWRKQIPFFAQNGYRVVVPDQRGYNLSSKPVGVKAYAVDLLVQDCVELIAALGAGSVYVVAHDWGAMVAWQLAEKHPERVRRMVILNVPHPRVLKRTLAKSFRQKLKSWYIGFFQLPALPEKLLSVNNYALLAATLVRTSRRGTFTPADLQRYREAWSQPGAVKAMINWYRALRLRTEASGRRGKITVPTLILWGVRDVALRQEMAQDSLTLCENAQLVLREDATHWIHLEESDFVNEKISAFFA
jgi:pimeloyl-ACP methyl ester carboxylesterase